MIQIFKGDKPSRYFLAPMAGITDIAFRSLMRRLGADVVISELLSSEGLIRAGKKTLELMAFCDAERPVGIQLFGSSLSSMVEAAKIVEARGADFVDVNLGCPVKKVVCDGGGAAWLKDPVALGKLLSAMKKEISIPLTIKIRTGWDENTINAEEIVRVAADSGAAWVAIHGRTRAQGYSGRSDWDLIREVAADSPLPIIGNGDILTGEDAREKLSYVDGVMIGRGALKNPWVFLEAKGEPIPFSFEELVDLHFDIAIESRGEVRAFLSLKKFLSWYASGYPNCSQFRQRLFGTKDVQELHRHAMDYFSEMKHNPRTVDMQPFLMGGHG